MSSGDPGKAIPIHCVLIHFSGHDHPGLTAEIARTLARHRIGVLDIGQAVVHEALSLGILIELPPDESLAALKTELTQRAHELQLHVKFSTVRPHSLEHWLRGLHQQHFIITILGRAITAEHLARVTTIIAGHAMNVDRIDRLSEGLSERCRRNACVELAISGTAAQEAQMRADFLAAAQDLSIDIAFQRESIFRRNRRLFAFDMDSTLIQGEVIDELAKMAGVGESGLAHHRNGDARRDQFRRELHAARGAAERAAGGARGVAAGDDSAGSGSRAVNPHAADAGLQDRDSFGWVYVFCAAAAGKARHRLRACERAGDRGRRGDRARGSSHREWRAQGGAAGARSPATRTFRWSRWWRWATARTIFPC